MEIQLRPKQWRFAPKKMMGITPIQVSVRLLSNVGKRWDPNSHVPIIWFGTIGTVSIRLFYVVLFNYHVKKFFEIFNIKLGWKYVNIQQFKRNFKINCEYISFDISAYFLIYFWKTSRLRINLNNLEQISEIKKKMFVNFPNFAKY